MFNFKKIFNQKKYTTDKMNSYFDICDTKLTLPKNKSIELLELGIYKGESLILWRDYFYKGHIFGLDMNPVEIESKDRITIRSSTRQKFT